MDERDRIIVGGGAAGLSAALVLGRARQRTLLIDAGAQSNLPAEGIGGLLGHDDRSPRDRTSVPEVCAAGDSAVMPSVPIAIASGSTAATMIVHDLVSEAHGLAQAA